MSVTTDHRLLIGGDHVASREHFEVVDPADGEPFATAPECDADMLDRAMDAAAQAFTSWRVDEDARRAALQQAARTVAAAVEELAALLTREQGKPLADARMEVGGVALWLNYYAGLATEPVVLKDSDRGRVEVRRRPLGVVAAITPWNFPLALAAWKVAPALRAGNTVVLKPSPYTPLATLRLGEVLATVLPAGVLNVVTGRDPLGAAMTAHATPRKVSFTGSTATGRHVAAAAAGDLKRVTLELGGNDAAIVLPDADLDAIASRLFWGAFVNNGQTCIAIKRLFVHDALHDGLVERLAQLATTVRVGRGSDDGVLLGPLNNQPQLDRVAALVDDAVAQGGTAVTGAGRIGGRGYFYAPTIVTNVDRRVRLVAEEQFGPALPVLRYSDVDDAIAAANATDFGLGASVWGSDAEAAAAVAAQFDSGTVWINTHGAVTPDQPLAGTKSSGIGIENGPWGLNEFTDLQVLHTTKRGDT